MLLTKRPNIQLTTARDELDRLFDRFLSGFPFALPEAPTLETFWSPDLDFSDTEREYVVRLEGPGIPKEDLEVNLSAGGDGRDISADRRAEPRRHPRRVRPRMEIID